MYVQTPMWLRKVTEKLQGKEYRKVGNFVSDVKLIFTNWASYNRVRNVEELLSNIKMNQYFRDQDCSVVLQANPELLALGDRLEQLFDSQFKVVFNIGD